MSFVDAEVTPGRKTGQIKLHGPQAFAAMRRAGQLTAQALDLLVERVRPGVTTQALDDFIFSFAMDHKRLSRAARLSWLSQIDLHIDQSCGVPWHSRHESRCGKATSSIST